MQASHLQVYLNAILLNPCSFGQSNVLFKSIISDCLVSFEAVLFIHPKKTEYVIFGTAIDLMQKWLPINYSFVPNQKCLTSLV